MRRRGWRHHIADEGDKCRRPLVLGAIKSKLIPYSAIPGHTLFENAWKTLRNSASSFFLMTLDRAGGTTSPTASTLLDDDMGGTLFWVPYNKDP